MGILTEVNDDQFDCQPDAVDAVVLPWSDCEVMSLDEPWMYIFEKLTSVECDRVHPLVED